ncbi:C40 family peptidase [Cohnella algarum]|nr:C40 family peptidase [Cohnella algarum]
MGTYVPKDQLQKGDLVFSDTNRDGVINHIAIYMGDDQLLHT